MGQCWFEKSEENICASRSVGKYITWELIVDHRRTCSDNPIVRASRFASLSSDLASQSLKRRVQIASMYYSCRGNMNDIAITHVCEKMHLNEGASVSALLDAITVRFMVLKPPETLRI